ncbi:MAG: hypothetical protein HYX24_02505 [Candidatus Aenigmarchaeota archaeon]|nr:hypothetical protein [Candidatus Aenigmarchaeota archaeon]
MKGQAATEMLAIVALVLAFLIPVWYYVSTLQASTAAELTQSYAESAVSRLAKAADSVFSQGKPAKIRMDVYIPKGVENISINGRNIIVALRTGQSISNFSETSISPLNGSLPTREGTYKVSVEAFDNVVQISYS